MKKIMNLITKIYEKIINDKKYRILFICFLGALSTIVLFITIGTKYGEDIYFHISRIKGIKDSFNIDLFPNIYSNYLNGYGYGNPLFYPDIFLYFPAFLNYIGLSVGLSYNIFLVIISILSCFTMYITVKGISKSKYAGIISSIIYAFASYRLTDMFTRAALGETLAFIFAPLIIYGIYHIIYDDYKKFYILVIGMSGLILSHIITSVMIFVVLFIMCLINIKKFLNDKKRIQYLIMSALITLLLTSYFIFPMLEQLMNVTYVVNSSKQVAALGTLSSRAVPIYALFLEINLLIKPWVPTGLGIIFIYIIYLKIKTRKQIKDHFTTLLFIIGLLSWIMSSNIFPWKYFENICSLIQFPWRLYFIATLLLTISGSIIIAKKFESKELRVKTFRNIFLVSMISLGFTTFVIFRRELVDTKDKYYIAMAEYLPAKTDRNYPSERGSIVTSNNDIELEYTKENLTMKIDFKNTYDDTKLELPLIYYKGYGAKINDKKLEVTESVNGLVEINVNDIEEGSIFVSYIKTPIIYITRGVSLLTLTLFILYLSKKGEKHEKEI